MAHNRDEEEHTIGSAKIWRSKVLLRERERKKIGFALASISDTCERDGINLLFF
jgi:hypothetical protein